NIRTSKPPVACGFPPARIPANPASRAGLRHTGHAVSTRDVGDLVREMAGLVIAPELAQRRLVQVGQNVAQFLGRGITGCEARAGDLAQRADEGVAVLVADFAILVAVAIVEAGLAHAALPGAHSRQHLPE